MAKTPYVPACLWKEKDKLLEEADNTPSRISKTMVPSYKHIQVGWIPLISVSLAILIVLYGLLFLHGPMVLIALLGLLILYMLSFCHLTVIGWEKCIEIRLGYSPFAVEFLISDIASCSVVRNPWYYGWGIRKIHDGWLFSTSGLDAVELVMHNGSRYRIGTDLPQVLAGFIQKGLKHTQRRQLHRAIYDEELDQTGIG